MKTKLVSVCAALLMTTLSVYGQNAQEPPKKVEINASEKTLNSQWDGKKVAYLGDSMTDTRRVGTTCVYWEYLSELMGIKPFVFGKSGNQWNDIYNQAVKMHEELGNNVDAIFIFCGTNDYSHGTPLGQFYSYTTKETNHNGKMVPLKYRIPVMDDTTFCGRINKAMSYLKNHYPQQEIIIMTPIHRGYAKFNDKNVQPEESFSNELGLYIDDYVNVERQAASNWAVPLIDLYSLSGMYPLAESQLQYFHSREMDRLHPNAKGDYRLAKTIQYQLLTLPATFVGK